MQITLNIDTTNFDGTILNLFENLTQDEKKEIARNVLQQYLSEPYDIEKKLFEFNSIQNLKNSDIKDWYGKYFNELTDEQIKQTSEFRNRMTNFKSSREQMITTTMNAAIEHQKEQINEMIRNDKQIQTVITEIMEKIKLDFPKTVHDAMVLYMTLQLSSMAGQLGQALLQSENIENKMKFLIEALNNKGIYV